MVTAVYTCDPPPTADPVTAISPRTFGRSTNPTPPLSCKIGRRPSAIASRIPAVSRAPRSSTTTRIPASAARIAHTAPPNPEPTTTTS